MEPAVSLVARPLAERRPFHEPAPDTERSRLLSRAGALPLACAACVAATAVFVAVDDPGDREAGLLTCPVRALTGQWCPGCGLTRATHHLLRGNIAQALSLNLFVPLVLVALVALWAVWLWVATGRGVPRMVRSLRIRTYAAAGLALALFTVIRNLEAFSVLRGG